MLNIIDSLRKINEQAIPGEELHIELHDDGSGILAGEDGSVFESFDDIDELNKIFNEM